MEICREKQTDYLPINRWLQDERPREKLIKKGSEYISDCELSRQIIFLDIIDNISYHNFKHIF